MTSQTLSIGPRGQITLPKKIRDLFKSNAVVLELVDNEHVMISPVPDVGGVISNYTKKTDLTFEEVRSAAWFDSRNNKVNK
jgi:bifunctional DNA-binding transcriptional regulator/antitoxin component of YhaV-PrlF toxin-antitoxin module